MFHKLKFYNIFCDDVINKMKNYKMDCFKLWMIVSTIFTVIYFSIIYFTSSSAISIPFEYMQNKQYYLQSMTPKYPPPLANFTDTSSLVPLGNIPVNLDDIVKMNQ